MTVMAKAQQFVLTPLEQMFEPRDLGAEGLALKAVDIVKGGAAIVAVSLLGAGLGYLGGDIPPMLANSALDAAQIPKETFRVAAGYGLPDSLGVILGNPVMRGAAAHQLVGGLATLATSLYAVAAPIASRLNPNYRG